MSFCYVMLCHTAPASALELAARIRASSPQSRVVMRFDDPEYLTQEAVEAVGAVRWVSPVHAEWGAFSLVEAGLEALAVARATTDSRYFVLISGQDRVIRSLPDWEREVTAAGIDALLEPLAEQPDDHEFRWWVVRPRSRLMTAEGSMVRRVTVAAGRRLVRGGHVLVRPGEPRIWVGHRLGRRTPPLVPVKAAQWVTLSDRAVDALVARRKEDPETVRFFRGVRLPDEWFAPSVLADDPSLTVGFGATTAKDFVPDTPNPRWLDLAALAHIRSTSRAPFARKFAPDAPREVVEEADRMARRTAADVDADVSGRRLAAPRWVGAIRGRVVPGWPA